MYDVGECIVGEMLRHVAGAIGWLWFKEEKEMGGSCVI